MPDLLRLDDDRGRFAGLSAILLTLFVTALSSRNPDWSAAVELLLFGIPAVVVLGLALARPRDAGPPPGWISAMLVAGFALSTGALVSLADLLGANSEDLQTSTVTWIAAVLAVVFAAIAIRRSSAVCTLLAASAAVTAVLAGVDWVFEPEGAQTYRWILVALGLVLIAAGIALYRDRGRHGVVLVVLSGIVIFGITITFAAEFVTPLFGGEGGDAADGIGWGWELIMLAFGIALAAFAAYTREPGPGYVSAFLLSTFVGLSTAGEEAFVGWPLVLLLLLLATLAGIFMPGDGRPGAPGAAVAGDGPREDPGDVSREVRL
ncbi:MAG: hypothetical protein M3320_02675 [Actinomycetota bacterium]|nr:hypothetical protein [Actinomycetota bacterium]MDQ5807557.1 hypothetical protein [Actinomycetota bacterium]